METPDIDFPLTPPHLHRCNASESAICTFKNNCIARICCTDETIPLILWDKFPPQCLITLNLLRDSLINPKLSSYAQIHGDFYFNRTPHVPTQTQLQVHKKQRFEVPGHRMPSVYGM